MSGTIGLPHPLFFWQEGVSAFGTASSWGGVSSLMSKAEAGSMLYCALNLGMGGTIEVAMRSFFLYFLRWGK